MATATDQSYGKIQALVKENPALGSTAAEKLAALVEELQTLEVSENGAGQKGSTDSFDKLKQGFSKFKTNVFDKNSELTGKLKTGQWPEFMVVACADSRVCPTAILGFQPGDAFIVRNVANMIPPWEKEGYPSIGAAVEYAVLHLKVKHILVIGHSGCGGVGALVKMTPDDGKYSTTFIERWVEIGKPARAEVKSKSPHESVAAVCKTCETESVKNSLNNLLTYPFVVEAVSDKKVSLHGGYYDFIEGSFKTWDFVPSKEVKA